MSSLEYMSRNTEAHNDHRYERVEDKNKYGRPIEICLYKKNDTIYVPVNDSDVIGIQIYTNGFAILHKHRNFQRTFEFTLTFK